MSTVSRLRGAPYALALVLIPSCGSQPQDSAFGSDPRSDGTLGSGDAGTFGATRPPPATDGGPCFHLQCDQVDCSSRGKSRDATTISGTVYDPAGKHPIYNTIVYIPNKPLQPFTEGVVCDRCGVLTTGQPIVTALSDANGKFVLRNVPVGRNIPLVVQVGKWRRQTIISTISACEDNPLTDRELTRLPRSQNEGDLPQMALVTGGCDAFECLLRSIGVADSEFTSSEGHGRVHVYKGTNGMGMYQSTASTDLWSDLGRMKNYDLIINSCECAEHAEEKPAASIQNHFEYANAGGRVFDTHYNYYWINHGPPVFASTASFEPDRSGPTTAIASIDTSFPKGSAFASWLQAVGASKVPGQIDVDEAKYDVSSLSTTSTRWIYGAGPQSTIFHYSFNTPVGAAEADQCGKVLFTDFHAAAGSNKQFVPFPGECNENPMTAQETALEFMLFDLSSCVQIEVNPPEPPPPLR